MTIHAVRCKRTGEALAVKMDGGSCACPSARECRLLQDKTGMRVLVCGGRAFNDLPLLDTKLDELHATYGFSTVIHGGASGADTMAHFWAGFNRVPIEVYHANWKKHGKAAGPLRNQRMIDEGRPGMVVAFSGGRGTADMTKRALAAGLPVFTYLG